MFTKLHKEERELLFKTNSVVAYEVYMHLKDKYSYFKTECYDLRRCIAEYLNIPERSIKEAIKRLKEVGLITATKKGKVNVYNFPILNKIEGITPKEESSVIEQEKEEEMQEEIEKIKTIINEEFGEYFVSDEEKYGEEVMNFLDIYEKELFNALNAVVDYRYFNDETKKIMAEGANNKIKQMVAEAGYKRFVKLEEYCADYIEDRHRKLKLERLAA